MAFWKKAVADNAPPDKAVENIAAATPATAAVIDVAAVPGQLCWQCNICGSQNQSPAVDMDRESGVCATCDSVMRFRTIVAILTKRLFGKPEILPTLPENRAITGIGMSDAHCYAAPIAAKLGYTNTYYHCEPLLDITQPPSHLLGTCDFVITSDVFEHVPPPIQTAFDNLYALLKPGGVVVFSVPFSMEAQTHEHYPNLHQFSIRQDENSRYVLDNITQDGEAEEFRDLVFHGGPGSTLEMRLFALEPLRQHFAAAGFKDVQVHDEAYFEHGIFWLHPWSQIISAIRPE